MKNVLSLFLCLGLLLQSFTYLVIFAGYEANKDYIARNLCVNKARPHMKCNGKCHMMKQMQKEEQKDNKGVPGSKNTEHVVLYSSVRSAFAFRESGETTRQFAPYQGSKSSIHTVAVFHPPLG